MGSSFVPCSFVDPGIGGLGGVGEGWVSVMFGATDASCWVSYVGVGFGRVVSSSCCSGVVLVVARAVSTCRASVVYVGSGCGVSFSAGSRVSASFVGVVL